MAVKTPRLYLGTERSAPTLTLLGIFAYALSILFVVYGGGMAEAGTHRVWSQAMLFFWGLLPPLWFMVEHFYYFPAHGNPEAGFETLKANQSVLTKAWLAGIVTLGLLYLQQFPVGAA